MDVTTHTAHRLIKLPAVTDKTTMARSTIYAKIKAGSFPAPIKLGPRTSAWLASEVDAWIEQQIAATKAAA